MDAPGLQDAGLHCPHCQYNLTGLPAPRCPECGTIFDWERVRQAAASPPRIAFERAQGWRKVQAFWLTWLTVLFAPWIFARQAVAFVSAKHALIFGGICFVGVAAAYVTGMEYTLHLVWLGTALIYLALQTVALTLADPAGWRRPWETARFWLLVSCYTSAIMLTECWGGPPLASIIGATHFFEDLWRGEFEWSQYFPTSLREQECLHMVQIVVWLAGLACCYQARVRRRFPPVWAWLAALLATFGLFLLYAAAVEMIGTSWYLKLHPIALDAYMESRFFYPSPER